MKSEISYAHIQPRYGGKFIAYKGGKVIVSASTYGSLTRKITRKRLNRLTLTIGFVPPKETPCIYAW